MDIRAAKTRVLPVDQIKPAAYNPRRSLKPGDPAWVALERSMSEFGNVGTLVWNERTGNLVGGHQRLAVLLHHGVEKVSVSVVDLDESQERALNLALNKISGEWDNEKLVAILDELVKTATLDATLSGFGAVEISAIIGGMAPGSSPAATLKRPDLSAYVQQYGVIVLCESEAEQKSVYEELAKAGRKCRVVTT